MIFDISEIDNSEKQLNPVYSKLKKILFGSDVTDIFTGIQYIMIKLSRKKIQKMYFSHFVVFYSSEKDKTREKMTYSSLTKSN